MFRVIGFLGLTVGVCLHPTGTVAKASLNSSEKTHARVCLDYDAPNEDMIGICQKALDEGGYSRRQHIGILDNLGDAYRNLEQWQKARAAYGEILQLDPSEHRGLNGLAWVAYDQGDYVKAMQLFQVSLDAGPSGDGWAGYAAAGYWGELLAADEALRLVDVALSIQGEDRWNLRTKGWILYEERRFEEAIKPFERALELNASDANARKGLAQVFFEIGRNEEALEHINAAAELRPDNVEILIWRSNIARVNGNAFRALRDAELVVEIAPKRSDGVVLKARAFSEMGMDFLAMTTLLEAGEAHGASSFYRYWTAYFLWRNDRLDDARAMIMRNVEGDDADGYDHKLLARIALEQDDLATAEKAVSAGLEIAPWMNGLMFLEVRIKVLHGKFDEAEVLFDKAIETGLPKGYVGDFAKLLIENDQTARALALRARHE
ncbi:tetratricopeptide repeat protein [Alisedimentitalea sp. MJ-SS2]|uniref:tetratricopeptide repeat protein n=1 Tax=Aliisedimentitalea sp. MJ-SS2 TaxID=3049795 RepID=UPI0029095C51|nr:tetratricopeptide repeat protein [Alisedimentitalea sp. MJ-SS2]MDU8927366.1 tetratricopeptide repeat protein [Alisedimentitalea sp. MJ-SS2]